ncbi:asparagine synthase (glutamine-hydrolyzing) [Candidatus Dependentiae bacterium]
MCGIAGFYCLQGRFPDNAKNLLDAMQQKMAHRGPDGSGVWVSEKCGVGFAHRRLSIQDLSEKAGQPFHSQDGAITIVFNGEIYNHPKLKFELESFGHRYTTNSDTESVVNAYLEWGADCLNHLDGMFAFAIFDSRSRELFLARDRFGVKPLYFSLQGQKLSFASEIKALWELNWIKREFSESAVEKYLTFMVTPGPLTIFRGIYKLPAGFLCRVKYECEPIFEEWYSPLSAIEKNGKKDFESLDFCVSGVRNLLKESVKKRLLSDVPVGALLSGGLDSSFLVGLMAQNSAKIKTFNIHIEGSKGRDERSWAKRVAKHFGTEHYEIVIDEIKAFNFFEKMVYQLDEPLADPVCIPFYFVTKMARECGVPVVQVGEGADELFMGYDFYKKMYCADRFLNGALCWMPNALKFPIHKAFRSALTKDSWVEHCLKNWSLGREIFWGGATALSDRDKRYLGVFASMEESDSVVSMIFSGIRQDLASYSNIDYHMSRISRKFPESDFCQKMTYLELKQRLPELLLMRADKMSMANGVEARVPFLDHKLVEFVLNIPSKFKLGLGGRKFVLKKAAEGLLQNDVIYRRKVGFGVPIDSWLKNKKNFFKNFCNLSNRVKSGKSRALLNSWMLGGRYLGAVRAWTYFNLIAIQ